MKTLKLLWLWFKVSEEKASIKEDAYFKKIRLLTTKHKEAEARAEFAENSIQKLQKEAQRIEEELWIEQERNKILQEDMESTLRTVQNVH